LEQPYKTLTLATVLEATPGLVMLLGLRSKLLAVAELEPLVQTQHQQKAVMVEQEKRIR